MVFIPDPSSYRILEWNGKVFLTNTESEATLDDILNKLGNRPGLNQLEQTELVKRLDYIVLVEEYGLTSQKVGSRCFNTLFRLQLNTLSIPTRAQKFRVFGQKAKIPCQHDLAMFLCTYQNDNCSKGESNQSLRIVNAMTSFPFP
jgi:hypothetical protein